MVFVTVGTTKFDALVEVRMVLGRLVRLDAMVPVVDVCSPAIPL